jgi:Protein of unknwon function (DUF3310)
MEPMNPEDKSIDHPSHYTVGSIEVYDFIEEWNLDFAIGNVVKYVARAPYKNSKLEDLKKARWYLNKAIEREEKLIAQRIEEKLSMSDIIGKEMQASSSNASLYTTLQAYKDG